MTMVNYLKRQDASTKTPSYHYCMGNVADGDDKIVHKQRLAYVESTFSTPEAYASINFVVCSFVRLLVWSFVRSLVRWFVGWLVGCLFVRSLICWFACLCPCLFAYMQCVCVCVCALCCE